ncbi:AcrR family transcriptional regulator [Spinactinospora alkalitolerans]|uniref:AcrR family transcriptional regulator n=1 Tax=Spinactinospora alkalitolerans TaxID=687207 RepID=A0A852TVD7_9ACTN|nr:helix-turn-helix domain-containing protein [Spinactinospora alkalitolerans]NYE47661.1 AcrR family transcriptional regulator [Spinactinospora alkalitolerans]
MTGEPAKSEVRGLRADAHRNHQRIIRAATELLAEHPAATMDELTAATDLGRTTVYRHFHTREQLVAEVYRTAFEGARQMFHDSRLHDCPVPELLDRTVAAVMGAVETYPVLINGPGLDMMVGEGGIDAGYADCLEPLEAAVGRAQAAGLLDPSLPRRWLASSLLDDCAGAVVFAAELRGTGNDPHALMRASFERAWGAR